MKRFIEIEGLDKTLELSKYTVIKNPKFKSLHIDELDDGTYRLIVGVGLIDDLQKLNL